jgi:hypothetical protein
MEIENQSIYYEKLTNDKNDTRNNTAVNDTRKIKIVQYANLGMIVFSLLIYLILTSTLWNKLSAAKLNGPFLLWLFYYVVIFIGVVCIWIVKYWKQKNCLIQLSLRIWIIVSIIIHLLPIVFVIIAWIALWIASAIVTGKGYSESTELFLQFFLVLLIVFFELWIILVVVAFLVAKRLSDIRERQQRKRVEEYELQTM